MVIFSISIFSYQFNEKWTMLIDNEIMEVHYITKSIYMAMLLSKRNYSNLPCHCNCNYERCSPRLRNNGKTFHAELLKNKPILNHIYHQMKYNQHLIKLMLNFFWLFNSLNKHTYSVVKSCFYVTLFHCCSVMKVILVSMRYYSF